MEHALTILGSSSALPTSQRFPSAQVLQMLERFFLIDCGEGTQMQLRKANIPFSKIQAVFISHLHGDHYLGIFGVLSSFNLLGRKTPLKIFAPKGFDKIVKYQLNFLLAELNFPLLFFDLPLEPYHCIFSDKKIDVYAIQLQHRIATWGFYFKEKQKEYNVKKEAIELYKLTIPQIVAAKRGEDICIDNYRIIKNDEITLPPKELKSYAYISDTIYNPNVSKYLHHVTLLYHEATFLHALLSRAQETYHSTALQAGEFAAQCEAQKLLIGHFSARYSSIKELEIEAQSKFLNTKAVSDLDVYKF
ncbi:MAG: Ribonuclease Z [Bacteroidetes bacterium ADurb.Bin217]|nr:MAG: Ribonuclease Z [Bacteroidetes bacterium ADurb.Bin217]